MGQQRTPGSTRSDRSRQLGERILTTALELLDSHGIDGLSMQRIALAAGLSTGPLYGRYDAPEDLVIDLWETSLRAELGMLLDDVATWCEEPGTPPAHLERALVEPSLGQRALIETLAVVRRYPFAAEVVRSDLIEDLAQVADATPSAPRSVPTNLVAITLGALLMAPFEDPEGPDSPSELLDRLSRMLTGRRSWEDASRDVPAKVSPLPIPESGDKVLDAFVRGAVLVTARTGYDKATTHRIARAAGRAYSSSYSRFSVKEELLSYAASSVVEQLFNWSVVDFLDLSRADYLDAAVSHQRGMISEEGRLWRQLRVELAVAARHHEEVASPLRAALESSRHQVIEGLEERVGPVDPAQRAAALSIWSLARANQFGMAVLAGASSFAIDVDWTPSMAVLFDMVHGEVFGPLGLSVPAHG